jgi:hypothetical protein
MGHNSHTILKCIIQELSKIFASEYINVTKQTLLKVQVSCISKICVYMLMVATLKYTMFQY